MRLGPRVQPKPDRPAPVWPVLAAIALIIAGRIFLAPGPEDVRRASPVLEPVVADTPTASLELPAAAQVPPVSFWTYKQVLDERNRLREGVRCLKQYDADGLRDDVEVALAACGFERN